MPAGATSIINFPFSRVFMAGGGGCIVLETGGSQLGGGARTGVHVIELGGAEQLEKVSVDSSGQVPADQPDAKLTEGGGTINWNHNRVVSDDCRRVLFLSKGTFAPGGLQGSPKVFVRDRPAATTQLGSMTDGPGGFEGDLSADGRLLLFADSEERLEHGRLRPREPYLRDLSASAAKWVEVPLQGAGTQGASVGAYGAMLSADGKRAVFRGSGAAVGRPVEERDLLMLEIASKAAAMANVDAAGARLELRDFDASDDGKRVVFSSNSDLWFYNLDTKASRKVASGTYYSNQHTALALSGNGRYAAYVSANAKYTSAGRVIVRLDLETGTESVVTRPRAGFPDATISADGPGIDGSGHLIAFTASAFPPDALAPPGVRDTNIYLWTDPRGGAGGSDGGAAGDSGGPGATDGGTDGGGCQGTCPAGFTKNGSTCTDDASAGWSGTLNPSGNWSYGSRAGSAQAFLPFGTHRVDRGITLWSPGALTPNVGFNAGSGEVVLDGSTAWAAGQLSLHPDGGTTAGVLRWNAPSAGKYTLQLNAKGLSGRGGFPVTTTRVRVAFVNAGGSTELFAQGINVSGGSNTATFSGVVDVLNPGDDIDVVVENGGNGFSYDTTGVSVTLSRPLCP